MGLGVVLLQLPQLGELQQHRVGVDERDGEAGDAIGKPAAQHIVAQERRRRVRQQVDRAGAPAALVHLLRRQRAVSIDAIEMVAEIADE